jgi:hypothetical protein
MLLKSHFSGTTETYKINFTGTLYIHRSLYVLCWPEIEDDHHLGIKFSIGK